MINQDLHLNQQKIHLAVDFLTDLHTSVVAPDLRYKYFSIFNALMHQKTTLADRFNATVDNKLSIVSPPEVWILYHLSFRVLARNLQIN